MLRSGNSVLQMFSHRFNRPQRGRLSLPPAQLPCFLPPFSSLLCLRTREYPRTKRTSFSSALDWLPLFQLTGCMYSWAHSFGQFKKHALLKARTQSPCFSYPWLARAFISAGSADFLSSGGVSVGCGARFTVLVAGLWMGENAAGLFANWRSHRLPMTILYKINIVAFLCRF